jgi:hypothetical protein
MSVPIGYNTVKASDEVKNEFRYPFDAALWSLDGNGQVVGLLEPDGSVLTLPGTSAYGIFYDIQTQLNSGANEINIVAVRETTASAGVSIVSNSRITVENPGVYDLEFSFQLNKSDSGSDDIDIWFAKNNDTIPYSNTRVTLLGNNGKSVASWNFMLDLEANDYVEIRWSSPDASASIMASEPLTNPVRPGIPSVILTVSQVR